MLAKIPLPILPLNPRPFELGSLVIVRLLSAYFTAVTEEGRCKSKLFIQITESRRNKNMPGENKVELDRS